MKYLASLLVTLLVTSTASAADVTHMPVTCKQTPSAATTKYPGEDTILTFNNLAKPFGKSENAEGQLVFFSGRVVDLQCVPVTGATVELWQANPFGKEIYPDAASLTGPNPMFAGAGRAYTNNQGKFSFVTLFPGSTGKNAAPKFNIRVTHPDLKPFNTALYFEGDRRNLEDPALKRIKELEKPLLQLKVDDSRPAMLGVNAELVIVGNDARKGF